MYFLFLWLLLFVARRKTSFQRYNCEMFLEYVQDIQPFFELPSEEKLGLTFYKVPMHLQSRLFERKRILELRLFF
jgi:hypothetical protein